MLPKELLIDGIKVDWKPVLSYFFITIDHMTPMSPFLIEYVALLFLCCCVVQ